MEEVSKKTLGVLLVLAILISVVGTVGLLMSLDDVDIPDSKPNTGQQTVGKGKVTLHVGEKAPAKVFEAQGLVALNVGGK